MEVTDLTTEEFRERVGDFQSDPKTWKYVGDKPCIVDFHALWCGFCKRLSPVLDELAEEYKDRLYIYKVDVDKEEPLETAFNIRTIPTLLFCSTTGNKELMLGTMSKQELKKLIEDKLM